MYYGMYVSAAGAHALNRTVEVLSNNLANVDTVGFKREFSLIEARDSEAIERGQDMRGSRGLNDLSGGAHLTQTPIDFSYGKVKHTQNKTDMLIKNPKDFFLVQRGDQEYLTRAGSFRFAPDGRMVTDAGDSVLGNDGSPIQVDPNLPWEIMPGGNIAQAGAFIPLALRRPETPGGLVKAGANLFEASQTEINVVPDNERSIENNALENSAVNPTDAMVELIAASRAYEANVKLIQHHDGMVGSLISRVLRA
jgi:flagellar basal body rod protein FlgG